MSDIAPEQPGQTGTSATTDATVEQLQAQLAAAEAKLQAANDDPMAKLQAQLDAANAKIAQLQSAPAPAPEQLQAHVAPSKAQQVLDAVASGAEITSEDIAEAKDEVQHYLNTAGPMKALVDAWEKLRQL